MRRRPDDSLSVPYIITFALIVAGFCVLGLGLNYALIKWVVAH